MVSDKESSLDFRTDDMDALIDKSSKRLERQEEPVEVNSTTTSANQEDQRKSSHTIKVRIGLLAKPKCTSFYS
jgi:hypothetical protein